MNAYSKDLRLKILSALDRGIPRRERPCKDLRRLHRDHRTLRKTKKARWRPRPEVLAGSITPTIGSSVEERRALWKQLEENDDATLERHCELWEKA